MWVLVCILAVWLVVSSAYTFQPYLRSTSITSTELYATNIGEKPRSKKEAIVVYNEEIATYKWNVSSLPYNSTSMRYLLGIKDEVTSFFTRIEQAILSIGVRFSSKVERDISTTSKASEYVARRTVKETMKLVNGITELSRPIMALPSAISRMSGGNSTLSLLDQPKLLGNLASTTTKERAKRKRAEKKEVLGVDSLYRSVRTLPARLQYDYERRNTAREVSAVKAVSSTIAAELPSDVKEVRVNADVDINMYALLKLSSELEWLQEAVLTRLANDELVHRDLTFGASATVANANISSLEVDGARELFIRISTLKKISSSLAVSIEAAKNICVDEIFTLNRSSLSTCLALTSCKGYLAQLMTDIETNDRIQTISSILTVLDAKFASYAETVPKDDVSPPVLEAQSSMLGPSSINSVEAVGSSALTLTKPRVVKLTTFREFLETKGDADAFEDGFEGTIVASDAVIDVEDRAVKEIIVETTAVSVESTQDEKIANFILTSIDIVFFLLEAVVKAAVPLVKGGGSRAVSRVSQTFVGAWSVDTPARKWISTRSKMSKKEAVEEESNWVLLESLKKSKRSIL